MSANLGRAVNASEGGLLVWIREEMEIGQTLKIKLFLLTGTKLVSIEAEAEIVWKDIAWGGDPGDYRVGIKFVNISREDLEKMTGFLRNLDCGRGHI